MDNTRELIELIRAGAQMDSEQISDAVELFLYDNVLYDVGENGDAIYQTIIKIDNDNEEELYSIYMVHNDMWGTEPDDEYRFVRVYPKEVKIIAYVENEEL